MTRKLERSYLCRVDSFSLSLTLSHSLSLSLTLSHSLTLSFSLTHTHSQEHYHSPFLSKEMIVLFWPCYNDLIVPRLLRTISSPFQMERRIKNIFFKVNNNPKSDKKFFCNFRQDWFHVYLCNAVVLKVGPSFCRWLFCGKSNKLFYHLYGLL